MSDLKPVQILLVDDQPGKLLAYESILSPLGETLIKAQTASEALALLVKTDVALILMDVCLPDIDGFELASIIRQHPRHERTAIIFVSGVRMNESDLIRGYETGAVDYVPVPVVPEILLSKVKIFVELYRKTHLLQELNEQLEQRVFERTRDLEMSGRALHQSEERLRLASEAARFASYEYDGSNGIIYLTANAAQVLGLENSRSITLSEFLEHVHPEERTVAERSLRLETSPETETEVEFRFTGNRGSTFWVLNRARAFGNAGEQDQRVLGTFLDIDHHKRAEEHQRHLMAELDHRVKNVLANVLAMARLSSANATSVPQFVAELTERLRAMAAAHDLLRRGNWTAAPMHELVRTALAPFMSGRHPNIITEGTPVLLPARPAQSLALLLHELATNAVKHGALSASGGQVTVIWSASEGEDSFKFAWSERGGPKVSKSDRRGFGLSVLETARSDLGGDASWEFRQEGFVFQLRGAIVEPAFEAQAFDPPVHEPRAQSPTANDASLSILIVEDEPLVAMQIQMDLEDDGHKVIGPATTFQKGMELAQRGGFDFAVLDVNLGAADSSPIAECLVAQNIPFVLATGFNDLDSLPSILRDAHRINKPYEVRDLRSILGQCQKAPAGN